MKLVKMALGMMMASLLLMTSCSKDSDGDKLSATIDGGNWSAFTRVTYLSSEGFVITGTSTTGAVLVVTVKGTTTGTYDLDANLGSLSGECLGVYRTSVLSDGNSYTSTDGTVTISSIDTKNKKISGTFSFTMYNLSQAKVVVKNGVFNDLLYTQNAE